jgi:putative acetyltransferase
MVAVRLEQPEDVHAIYQVNLAAFARTAEADLVQALRRSAEPFFSFAAEYNREVVGHVAFSPVTIGGAHRGLGLAPMAVTPFLQRRGIGTALINASLQSLREKPCAWVVVLGHPSYYPRFGFRPAREHGITCEYRVSPEAFMVLELLPNALEKVTGIVSYHSAFAFPIILGGEVTGVMEFFSRGIYAPDDDLLSMLTALGTQIAKFIERERMAEQLAQYTENC